MPITVPAGVISIWSGPIALIPAGWALCDGTAGTPDLRDRFVIGAGGSHVPDATGGSATHDHPFTTDGHDHFLESGAAIGLGIGFASTTSTDTDSGTTDAGSSIPPFYALAYIMKI